MDSSPAPWTPAVGERVRIRGTSATGTVQEILRIGTSGLYYANVALSPTGVFRFAVDELEPVEPPVPRPCEVLSCNATCVPRSRCCQEHDWIDCALKDQYARGVEIRLPVDESDYRSLCEEYGNPVDEPLAERMRWAERDRSADAPADCPTPGCPFWAGHEGACGAVARLAAAIQLYVDDMGVLTPTMPSPAPLTDEEMRERIIRWLPSHFDVDHDPRTATGAALDRIAALTGVPRREERAPCWSDSCTLPRHHTGLHDPPSPAQARRIARGFMYGSAHAWPSDWTDDDRERYLRAVASDNARLAAREIAERHRQQNGVVTGPVPFGVVVSRLPPAATTPPEVFAFLATASPDHETRADARRQIGAAIDAYRRDHPDGCLAEDIAARLADYIADLRATNPNARVLIGGPVPGVVEPDPSWMPPPAPARPRLADFQCPIRIYNMRDVRLTFGGAPIEADHDAPAEPGYGVHGCFLPGGHAGTCAGTLDAILAAHGGGTWCERWPGDIVVDGASEAALEAVRAAVGGGIWVGTPRDAHLEDLWRVVQSARSPGAAVRQARAAMRQRSAPPVDPMDAARARWRCGRFEAGEADGIAAARALCCWVHGPYVDPGAAAMSTGERERRAMGWEIEGNR